MSDRSRSAADDSTLLGAAQAILTLLLGDEQATKLLDMFGVTIITSVLDADIIIRDLSRYIQTGQATGLMIAAKFGGVRFFASTAVQQEVPLRVNRVTGRRGIAPEEAQRVWHEKYEPLITFLDPTDITALSPRAALVDGVDPKDTPTGQLIDLIRPQQALSGDHSLAAYSPVATEWTQVAVAFRDIGMRDASFVALYSGGGLTIWIGVDAIHALISLVRIADKRVLVGLGIAAVVSVGLLIAVPSARRWLIEKLQSAREGGFARLGNSLVAMAETLARMDQQAEAAHAFIGERQLTHEPPRQVREYVINILSHTHVGLTPAEISQRMIQQGYRPKGQRPARYVARVLRENSKRFERLPTGRWTLRSVRWPTAS
jgi:hypothetical protein